MRSTTRAAVSVDALLVRSQQALDLSELGVRLLQHRGTTLQNVEAEVVADRHLVTQTTEIPGESGHSLGQLLTPLVQLGALLNGRGGCNAPWISSNSPPPAAGLLSLGGGLPPVPTVFGSFAAFLA